MGPRAKTRHLFTALPRLSPVELHSQAVRVVLRAARKYEDEGEGKMASLLVDSAMDDVPPALRAAVAVAVETGPQRGLFR